MSRSIKSKTVISEGKLLAGLQKNQATLPPSFTLAGKVITPLDCIKTLQGRITAANATDADKATWQASVKANLEEQSATQPLVADLKQQLKLWYKNAPDTLADFGLAPNRKATKTPVIKVVAAEKALATRKARHTMGSQQKKDVKGTVPATLTIAVSAGQVEVPPSPAPAPGDGPPAVPANANGGAPPVSPSPNGTPAPKAPNAA